MTTHAAFFDKDADLGGTSLSSVLEQVCPPVAHRQRASSAAEKLTTAFILMESPGQRVLHLRYALAGALEVLGWKVRKCTVFTVFTLTFNVLRSSR